MPANPTLSTDEVLSTTRSVRRRLDLERPVARELIEECLELAVQAPTGGNQQDWAFVVVTDAEQRARIAELYRRGCEMYIQSPGYLGNARHDDPDRQGAQERIASSFVHLAEHCHEVPALVIPCISPRPESVPQMPASAMQASIYSSILPAAWSFQLAARSRGLVTCWTTLHLLFEKEVAEILGISYDAVLQTGLIFLAHPTGGTGFSPARREPLETKVHWDAW